MVKRNIFQRISITYPSSSASECRVLGSIASFEESHPSQSSVSCQNPSTAVEVRQTAGSSLLCRQEELAALGVNLLPEL